LGGLRKRGYGGIVTPPRNRKSEDGNPPPTAGAPELYPNQTATVRVTPSFGGGSFWTYLLNPDGSSLALTQSSSSVTFSRKTLASTGTYQIVVLPSNGVTGSVVESLTNP